jgi:hypothetical protein
MAGRKLAPKRSQHPDPIGDYVEWTNHRYDPGYYLGGNIPPLLRKATLGPRARRLSGIWLAIKAALAMGSIAAFASIPPRFTFWELAFDMALAALIVSAAAAMLRSTAGESKPRARRHRP